MDFDPQSWAQLGAIGIAFVWLLRWVMTEMKAALDKNTRALETLTRQVQVNTLLVARIMGQDVADLKRLLANGGGGGRAP